MQLIIIITWVTASVKEQLLPHLIGFGGRNIWISKLVFNLIPTTHTLLLPRIGQCAQPSNYGQPSTSFGRKSCWWWWSSFKWLTFGYALRLLVLCWPVCFRCAGRTTTLPSTGLIQSIGIRFDHLYVPEFKYWITVLWNANWGMCVVQPVAHPFPSDPLSLQAQQIVIGPLFSPRLLQSTCAF